MPLEVTDAASVASMVNGVLERYGRIDVLVNNAGITRDQLMLRMKREDWDDVIATNLTPAFVLVQAVLGGVTVLTGLNPVTVMSHFLLSMVTLVVATMLVWSVMRERAGKDDAGEEVAQADDRLVAQCPDPTAAKESHRRKGPGRRLAV